MPEVQIITTSDGSHSLLNTTINETYHSVHGAIQESQHVFIRHGLDYILAKTHERDVNLLEVGYGTGLNVLLTLLHAGQPAFKIYYESWEAFPLESSVLRQLNYGDILGSPDEFNKIVEALWDQPTYITPGFILNKRIRNVLLHPFDPARSFDLIYYDAFAPSKQEEMWTMEVIKKVIAQLAPGGAWVTYCAKGQVKRNLRSLGLTVETLPGPPGKKEMIRALR